MNADASAVITLRSDPDIVRARQTSDRLARALGMTPRDRARLDLVVAEVATNVIRHAGHGTIVLTPHTDPRVGVQICCQDDGPGFPEPAGRTSGGLGLGLAVVQELSDALAIHSNPGAGTRVEASIWA